MFLKHVKILCPYPFLLKGMPPPLPLPHLPCLTFPEMFLSLAQGSWAQLGTETMAAWVDRVSLSCACCGKGWGELLFCHTAVPSPDEPSLCSTLLALELPHS